MYQKILQEKIYIKKKNPYNRIFWNDISILKLLKRSQSCLKKHLYFYIKKKENKSKSQLTKKELANLLKLVKHRVREKKDIENK